MNREGEEALREGPPPPQKLTGEPWPLLQNLTDTTVTSESTARRGDVENILLG